MSLLIPDLDDRTYADLVAEALDLIPLVHPEWTDRNPSDPGIALVELLAWVTEMMVFRVGQVTDRHTRAFLELLDGVPRDVLLTGPDLAANVRETLRDRHEPRRAVTAADYEDLAWHAAAAAGGARRVHCLPGWNLDAATPVPETHHVAVLVVTDPPPAPPAPEVVRAVSETLRACRLLGTRHSVAGPGYVDLTVTATLAFHDDADPGTALDEAARRVREHLSPLPGGDRDGWPLGRAVHPTEIVAVLEDVDRVDYVEDVTLTPSAGGRTVLLPHQLVGSVRVLLTGYDTDGIEHTGGTP